MKRPLYSYAYLYLTVGFAVTLIGFYNTYFSRLSETDTIHHFHGITGTLWMIILIVQPWLYSQGKMRAHRVVGWISLIVSPIVFYGAYLMIRLMMSTREPNELLYQFAFLDTFTLLPFPLFIILGVVYRRNVQYHSRFMICTIFGPLSAGIVRIFYLVLNDWNFAITGTYILFELIIILLIIDDYRLGKIRAPYVLCFLIFLFQHVLIYFVGEWDWWKSFTLIFV